MSKIICPNRVTVNKINIVGIFKKMLIKLKLVSTKFTVLLVWGFSKNLFIFPKILWD